MRLVIALILLPLLSLSQHKGVSYNLTNEIGTFELTSLTFTHEIDNTEGITYVVNKRQGDTLYQINQFLDGWVALSNDGQTIAHLQAEKDKDPLDQSVLTMFRNGRTVDSAPLGRLVSYELKTAVASDRLPKSGWLRNDSLYNLMAENPFYVTDDKLFLSFDTPKLTVFDMGQMVHIYNGNGANHFHKNYYSIPNPPLRDYMETDEFFPEGFPKTTDGLSIEQIITNALRKRVSSPEKASSTAEILLKLNSDGRFELRKASVLRIKNNEKSDKESQLLKELIEQTSFDSNLIPPKHPAWIFSQTFWLR